MENKPLYWRPVGIRKKCGGPVKNIGRVERTLKLIIYLSEWRTIKECTNHIQVTPRSIQRYFKMLVDLGFIVEAAHGGVYAHRIKNIRSFFCPRKAKNMIDKNSSV